MSDVASSMSREDQAMHVVHNFMGWTFAGGLIPVPLLDIAAVTAAQLRMLQRLSEIYDIPFSRNLVKELISSLLGSTVPSIVTSGIKGAGLNMVPVLGPLVGAVLMPGLSSATTFAIGKVFIQHFESGGTFLDFKPAEVREHFRQVYAEARQSVTSSGTGGTSRTTAAATS
jgi:uncharacterized protein (DUF697 family)